ncbi:MAG TPA: DegT/DnrJ/EryC1/StrS family aminotransferase, partial [Trueperaceae bacterium]|nr:DegT/DnrJ/EryC1/StrS family aminotransferase [Trueperaceae bacterium]
VQVPADRRPAYERALTAAGVEFSRFYPSSLTSQPVGSSFGSAPHANAVTSRVLSLPIRPSLSEEEVGRVTDALAAAERG